MFGSSYLQRGISIGRDIRAVDELAVRLRLRIFGAPKRLDASFTFRPILSAVTGFTRSGAYPAVSGPFVLSQVIGYTGVTSSVRLADTPLRRCRMLIAMAIRGPTAAEACRSDILGRRYLPMVRLSETKRLRDSGIPAYRELGNSHHRGPVSRAVRILTS